MRIANQYLSIIGFIRKVGYGIMLICILGELIFFNSLPNICGCIMCFFSWWTFSKFFLKREIILRHPFAWLFYLSMVLYRYLPLVATFFELKPVTYGFENPYYTIWGEMFLFAVQSLAFYIVCYGRQNVFMPLRNFLRRMDFFTSFSNNAIWCMGFIGLLAMFITQKSGGADYGDVGGKFLAPMAAMKFVPLVMFFPALYKAQGPKPSTKVLLLYLLLLEVLSLMGNSREALIHPLGCFVVLAFLNVVKQRTNFKKFVYSWKFPALVLLFVVSVKAFTMVSDAMLANRGVRTDVSAVELMKLQMSAINSSGQDDEEQGMMSYFEGWDETYVDNFLLNRYCNMRITDETMYWAMRLDGWDTTGNDNMRDAFFTRLLSNLPTPVLRFLSIDIDKSDIQYSEGDYLYALATSTPVHMGYRVASHLALGMGCFGLFYFPIQFVLLLLSFYLLDTIVLYRKDNILYSLAGLAIVFDLVGRFRNANGCVDDASYLVRGYWQFLFLYWITFYVAKTITNLFRK